MQNRRIYPQRGDGQLHIDIEDNIALQWWTCIEKKITNRQRTHLLSMGPVHADSQGALNILLDIDPVVELPFDVIKEALIIVEDNLIQIPDVYMEVEHKFLRITISMRRTSFLIFFCSLRYIKPL